MQIGVARSLSILYEASIRLLAIESDHGRSGSSPQPNSAIAAYMSAFGGRPDSRLLQDALTNFCAGIWGVLHFR